VIVKNVYPFRNVFLLFPESIGASAVINSSHIMKDTKYAKQQKVVY
jgi:hypothetical protein